MKWAEQGDSTGCSTAQPSCDAPHVETLGGLAGEQHFTPKELAHGWALSETKIRRMFAAEPGVLRIGEPSRRIGRKLKRHYHCIRIPQSTAERVWRKLASTSGHQR